MDAAVVYCSQTGSAKTYASWMAEELGCTPKPLDNIEIAAANAELVIFVSWFHAASLKGTKRFQAYMAEHPEKRYAVVAVGATPMPCDLWPASEHEEASVAPSQQIGTPTCLGSIAAAAFTSNAWGRWTKLPCASTSRCSKAKSSAATNVSKSLSMACAKASMAATARTWSHCLSSWGCGDSGRRPQHPNIAPQSPSRHALR